MNRPYLSRLASLAALALMALVLAAGPALAADGRVLVATGTIVVERPDGSATRTLEATSGFDLLAGDTIRTGADGRVQFRLADGAIFSLQPLTTFRIDEYAHGQGRERGFFSLLRGALRTTTGQIGKQHHEDYRLKTPTATVGIRGTHYLAQETVCDPVCSPGSRAGLHVAVIEGRIAVANEHGSVEIGAGESAEVEPDAAPRQTASAPRLPPRQLAANSDEGSAPAALAAVGGTGGLFLPTAGEGSDAASTAPNARRTRLAGLVAAPAPSEPAPSEPAPSEPAPSEPAPSEPAPSEPAPEEPAPEEPAPEEPAPEEPAPEEPAPEEPAPEEPGPEEPGPEEPGPVEIPPGGETPSDAWQIGLYQLRGSPSLNSIAIPGGRLGFDDARRLTSIGFCPALLCLSSGTTRIAEAGADPWTSWGRWTDGEALLEISGLPVRIAYGPNTGMHYLVGSPALTVPTSGEFTYALTGATAPTISNGQWAPGTFSGSAAVRFDPGQAARVGLDATVSFGQENFRIATQGGVASPADSQITLDARHGFEATVPVAGPSLATAVATPGAGNTFCPDGGCTARLNGGLYGPTGERLGLGYTIEAPGQQFTTIDGVGVFTRQ